MNFEDFRSCGNLRAIFVLLTIFIFLIIPDVSIASSSDLRELANSRAWRRLLYFPDELAGESSIEATGNNFFFAGEMGAKDAHAELKSTIQEFLRPPSDFAEDSNEHPRCRFPARYHWLAAKVPELQELPAISCPRMERFHRVLLPKQVDLLFASAYINSPASMYGHTMLRLQRTGKTEGNELLDYIVAFGAKTEGATGFSYVVRGLAGGFSGEFTTVPYYLKIREYLDMESRDLWSYALTLTEEEREMLVLHLWELRGVAFPYFFLGGNCSYFLLRFLEAVMPELDVSRELPIWVIPIDTIRLLQGQGVLGEPIFRASRLHRMRELRSELSKAERDLAYKLVREKDIDEVLPTLDTLTAERKAKVLDAAYEYYRYRNPTGSEAKKDSILIEREQSILYRRGALPIAPSSAVTASLESPTQPQMTAFPPTPPERAHASNRLGVEFGAEVRDAITRFSWRPAIHDLLGDPTGLDPFAEQEILHTVFQYEPDRESVYLQSLRILSVRAHQPLDPWFSKLSWRMQLGLNRDEVLRRECSDWKCLTAQMEGGAGFTVQPFSESPAMIYALAVAKVHAGGAFDPNYRIGLALETGLRIRPFSRWSILGEWNWDESLLGDRLSFATWRGTTAVQYLKNQELRLHYVRSNRQYSWSAGVFVYY